MISADVPPAIERRASTRPAGSSALLEDPRAMVAMGHLKVGGHSDQLQAVLGSCVGIAFLWKKGGVCGLAHCLLPEAPAGDCRSQCGRYVSLAVPELLRLMGANAADYPDIQVYLAGGANMLGGCSSRLHIGDENAAAAQKYLRQLGLTVHYCRLGGRRGRVILVDCAEYSCYVRDILTPSPDLLHGNY